MRLKKLYSKLFNDTLPESARKKRIEERQQQSVCWWLAHRLGSLPLAMLLLAVLIIACIVGTIYETDFSAKVARYYVYDAPWFIIWLIILAINLFSVILTRWPWRSKHLGFITTHIGIIILLTGSIIGKTWGYEGTFTLQKNDKPSSRVIIDRSVILVESPANGEIYSTPIAVEAKNTLSKPKTYPLPDSSAQLIVEKFTDHLVEITNLTKGETASPQGIELELKSPMVSEPVIVPLILDDATQSSYDFFGMGKIVFQSNDLDIKPKMEAFRESQMALANHPELPLKINEHDHDSGYQFILSLKDKTPQITLITPQGDKKTYNLSDVLKKEQKFSDQLTFVVSDYWPDFVMENGKPRSKSNEANNPAMLVHLSGQIPEPTKPALLLKPSTDNKLQFKLYQNGKITSTSILSLDQSINTGLGPWQMTIKKVESHAAIHRDVKMLEKAPSSSTASVPGILVHLKKGLKNGSSVWIPSGTSRNVAVDDIVIRIGFGLETKLIPVAVSLLNFEVPFDEGTRTPANYKATVRFDDIKTQATGNALIEMNTPAIFPNESWRAWTGFTYKFSQAGWNPENLNESTLQVLYDPGWLFKWIGSLMICIGIGIMFYYKPSAVRKEQV